MKTYTIKVGSLLVYASFCFLTIVYGLELEKENESLSRETCHPDYDIINMIEMPDCYPNYILAFEDNFNGVILDRSKWTPRVGPVRGWIEETESFKDAEQWYQPENVSVQDGELTLRVEEDGAERTFEWEPGIEISHWFDYTSGEIDSKRKFREGFFEISCSLPADRGFFPAFWVYGEPPRSEIDIFEINTTSKRHTMTVHRDFTGNDDSEYCPEGYSWSGFNTNHIYGCEYAYFHISFYVDGFEKWRYYHYGDLTGKLIECDDINIVPVQLRRKKLWPIEPGEIIANLAVFNNDDKPDATTTFPSYYNIDYIKYYMDIKDPPPIEIENTEELELDDRYFNLIAGQYVSFTDNVALDENDQLEVLGEEYIDLLPGVEFSYESVVNLRIEPLLNTGQELKSTPLQSSTMSRCKASITKNEMEDSGGTGYVDFDFEFYPNPNNGKSLSIRYNRALDEDVVIKITNSMGFCYYSSKISGSVFVSNHAIDLQKGLYLLCVSIPNIGYSRNVKLIVN